MAYDSHRHRRRSIRLHGYDYATAGMYFVTLVCHGRELLLEDLATQRIVEESWLWLANQYDHVVLDEYVIMPNHLHGILVIEDCVGAVREPPLPARKPLGRLIGAFKTVSTKRINLLRDTPGERVWQRNYYERVIRGLDELHGIREYIARNPLGWADDPENPTVERGTRVGAVREPPRSRVGTRAP